MERKFSRDELDKNIERMGGFLCKGCGSGIYPRDKYYYLDENEEYPICDTCNEILNNANSDDLSKQNDGIIILRRKVGKYDSPEWEDYNKRYIPQEVQNIIRQKLAEAERSLEEKKRNQISVTDEEFKKTLKRGDDGYYLYHSYKNEDALIYVVVISFLVFFIKNGFFWSISVWLCYYFYCEHNNAKLDNNPNVLKKRKVLKEIYTEKLNKRRNGKK